MSAFLLTWNPDKSPWPELGHVIASLQRGRQTQRRWSSGTTKSIPVGSRVYMLKQGPEPRGIMAAGWTTGEVWQDEHWDSERAKQGDTSYFVPFVFECILDPARHPLLEPTTFPPGPAQDVHWTPAASGTSIPDAAATEIEQLWSSHVSDHSIATEIDDDVSAFEGEIRIRMVRHRSRERALRDAKIKRAMASGDLRCEVPGCGFDFEHRYGPIGRGYAQVHHRVPLHTLTSSTSISLEDLAIVCANCHVMIHAGGESRALDALIPGSRHGDA